MVGCAWVCKIYGNPSKITETNMTPEQQMDALENEIKIILQILKNQSIQLDLLYLELFVYGMVLFWCATIVFLKIYKDPSKLE